MSLFLYYLEETSGEWPQWQSTSGLVTRSVPYSVRFQKRTLADRAIAISDGVDSTVLLSGEGTRGGVLRAELAMNIAQRLALGRIPHLFTSESQESFIDLEDRIEVALVDILVSVTRHVTASGQPGLPQVPPLRDGRSGTQPSGSPEGSLTSLGALIGSMAPGVLLSFGPVRAMWGGRRRQGAGG